MKRLICAYLISLLISLLITHYIFIKSICLLQLQGVWRLNNDAMMLTIDGNKLSIATESGVEIYDFEVSYSWKLSFIEHKLKIKCESPNLSGDAELFAILGVLTINGLTFYRDSRLSVDYMQ
jgi:hypothetical protein